MSNRQTKGFYVKFLVLLLFVSIITMGAVSAKDVFDKKHAPVKEDAGTVDKKPKEAHAKGKGDAKAKDMHAPAAASHEVKGMSAEQALKKLMEGNKRFVSEKMAHKRQNAERRAEIAGGQRPFAIIVSCSDSRVPPEVIFDQGLGDLFVIRTAGHVVDDIAVGSIEYAVEHLGVCLIMVVGHKRCGAVDATVKGGTAPGQIGKIVEAIKPAVEKAKGKHGDLLNDSIVANSKLTAQKLLASKPILSELAEDGVLRVVGAYYDLDTGEVSRTYRPCMLTNE